MVSQQDIKTPTESRTLDQVEVWYEAENNLIANKDSAEAKKVLGRERRKLRAQAESLVKERRRKTDGGAQP